MACIMFCGVAVLYFANVMGSEFMVRAMLEIGVVDPFGSQLLPSYVPGDLSRNLFEVVKSPDVTICSSREMPNVRLGSFYVRCA